MEKLDPGLRLLLAAAKRRGFLTFNQVNECLQDAADHPELVTHLLETIDEMGIELVTEDEAELRVPGSVDIEDDLVDEPEPMRAEEEDEDDELSPEDSKDTSQPEATTRSAPIWERWARSPMLRREQELEKSSPGRSRSHGRGSVARCSSATSHSPRWSRS